MELVNQSSRPLKSHFDDENMSLDEEEHENSVKQAMKDRHTRGMSVKSRGTL